MKFKIFKIEKYEVIQKGFYEFLVIFKNSKEEKLIAFDDLNCDKKSDFKEYIKINDDLYEWGIESVYPHPDGIYYSSITDWTKTENEINLSNVIKHLELHLPEHLI